MILRVIAVLALATVAACARPVATTSDQRSDARAMAACRARADSVYESQNRGAIYTGTDSRDTPRSAGYLSGITTRGLGERFDRDQQIDSCLRASGDDVRSTPGGSTSPTLDPAVH